MTAPHERIFVALDTQDGPAAEFRAVFIDVSLAGLGDGPGQNLVPGGVASRKGSDAVLGADEVLLAVVRGQRRDHCLVHPNVIGAAFGLLEPQRLKDDVPAVGW